MARSNFIFDNRCIISKQGKFATFYNLKQVTDVYVKKTGVPKRNAVVPHTVHPESRFELRSKFQTVSYLQNCFLFPKK